MFDARAMILDMLSDGGTHHESAIVNSLLARRSVGPLNQRDQLTLRRAPEGWPDVDPDDAVLVRQRVITAVREILAELWADGVITPVEGSAHGEATASIPLHLDFGGSTTTGSHSVPSRQPVFGHTDFRWRFLRPVDHHRSQLARANLTDGLEGLLGPRGIEVLREAVECFHRGRFLAAADLLAAASEAAWFVVAAATKGSDRKLDDLVAAGENAAEVIHRTNDALMARKALPLQTLRDVRAQAARMRDLRNYGLHPVGEPDVDREDAFTEPGCAALFMGARRYFTLLDTARRAYSV